LHLLIADSKINGKSCRSTFKSAADLHSAIPYKVRSFSIRFASSALRKPLENQLKAVQMPNQRNPSEKIMDTPARKGRSAGPCASIAYAINNLSHTTPEAIRIAKEEGAPERPHSESVCMLGTHGNRAGEDSPARLSRTGFANATRYS